MVRYNKNTILTWVLFVLCVCLCYKNAPMLSENIPAVLNQFENLKAQIQSFITTYPELAQPLRCSSLVHYEQAAKPIPGRPVVIINEQWHATHKLLSLQCEFEKIATSIRNIAQAPEATTANYLTSIQNALITWEKGWKSFTEAVAKTQDIQFLEKKIIDAV